MLSSRVFGVICVAIMAMAIPQKGAYAAFHQCGVASYYHEDYLTATGERYKPDGISAAHRTLPLGSIVRVRHQRTGREVVVRINDRGPYIKGRIIDLSRGAKRVIGMDGLAPVCITVIGKLDRKTMVRHAKADTSIPTNARRRTAVRKARKHHRRYVRHHGRRHHRYTARWRSRYDVRNTRGAGRP